MFKYSCLQLECIKLYYLLGVELKIFGDGDFRNHFRLYFIWLLPLISSELVDLNLDEGGKHGMVSV